MTPAFVPRRLRLVAHCRRPTLATACFFLLFALFHSSASLASAGGRDGFSGNPATNGGADCSVCHAPDGAAQPMVGIVGPSTLDAGTTSNFFVVVSGELASEAGINISSGEGIGKLLPFGSDLQARNGELVHASPKALDGGGVAAFVFRYTAPNYDANVTLYAAGNATNGALDLQGDGVGTTVHSVTIRNGFEEPPPPPQTLDAEVEARLFASGFASPVAIEHAGDDRLFVVERGGRIRIVRPDGSVESTPFLDITNRVADTASEMGLLGLAFHPRYSENGFFYVYYTREPAQGDLRSRVARFTVSANSADVANAASERVIMEFRQPFRNHNAGDMHFGPSGYLHIASGDGGSGGDPQNNGQKTRTLLGKMLRIDVDTQAGPGNGPDCNLGTENRYAIPPGNAFADGQGGAGCDEIFALGLRNPWRFAFDALTGDMWIADVGQNRYEEVHVIPAGDSGGLNLGWRCYEGDQPFNLTGCNQSYLPPVHTYAHATSGCSITGGRVYRGPTAFLLRGNYLFSDFCQSSIRALSGPPGNLRQRVVLPEGTLSAVSTFGEDSEGEVYVGELNSGNIYRLEQVLPPGC